MAYRKYQRKILTLVEEHSRPGVVVVFTDGSVLTGVKSGWGGSVEEWVVL